MNTDFRKKGKNDFEKDFFKLMNNAVFGKDMKIVRKDRDINTVTTERRWTYLVSEPNCHTTKFFTEYLLAIEIRKTKILMDKPVSLGLSKKIHVWVLVWLCKTKIWWKRKFVLYGYRQFH